MAIATGTLADRVFPHPQAQAGVLLRDALLVLGGASVVAGLAQISDHQIPVPHTGQTLGVLLVGAALGWRRGGLALLAYVVGGVAGLPIFADGTSGLVRPTGGYLVGFIVAAALIGWLAELGWDRTPWMMALAMVLGNLVIYTCGVPWLAASLHLPLSLAYQVGMQPYLLVDALKLAIAVVLLPGAWFLVGRGTPTRSA